MEQQNSESGRQSQPTAEKTNEFTKMWEELGQGGKLIFSLFIFFLAYNIFGGTSSGTWIDVNEARARPLLKSGRVTLANGGIGGRLEKGNYGSGEVGQKNICITRFPS